MTRTLLAAAAFITSATMLVPRVAQTQDEGIDPAIMQKMMELAAPGAEHEALAHRVGAWKEHYKFRMGPGLPWNEADGRGEIKPLLGGRYIMEETHFEMMGMPMEGLQILGFDKGKGEYISLWMDTNSTWWITSRGKKTKDGAIEFKGTMVDVAGERPYRMVVREKGKDLIENEMYDTIGFEEVHIMTIRSTRSR